MTEEAKKAVKALRECAMKYCTGSDCPFYGLRGKEAIKKCVGIKTYAADLIDRQDMRIAVLEAKNARLEGEIIGAKEGAKTLKGLLENEKKRVVELVKERSEAPVWSVLPEEATSALVSLETYVSIIADITKRLTLERDAANACIENVENALRYDLSCVSKAIWAIDDWRKRRSSENAKERR